MRSSTSAVEAAADQFLDSTALSGV